MDAGRNFEVFSWDNGNANEKFVYKNEQGEIEGKIFPSLTTEVLEGNSVFELADGEDIFKKDSMKMQYEGKTYFIGELAQEQDSKGGNRDQLDDKYKATSTITKLLSGIVLAVGAENVDIVNIEHLMLGLSINIHEDMKEDVEKFYSDGKFEFKIPTKDGYKKCLVTIQKAICIAQGVGAFYDEVLKFNGYPKRADLLKKRYLLIDGGGGTTERFIADGKRPIVGTEEGLKIGANDIFQKIGKLFNNAPAQIIEKIYKDKDDNQYWNSKDPIPVEKVTEYCKQAFNNRARYLYQTITNDLKEQLNRVGTVLVCGGIVAYLYDDLKELFKDRFEVIKSENPIFSNARGYFKYYAAMTLKRRLKKTNS
ncbi:MULTISPECIES: ParM/StbA family protein [unclassified Candidatus Frackibacter]|uniref:ParM/StbA family protein n=1 Tax=unclassified Candidatus Frackibacter TaxID=2648818 RepID=UPI0008883E45|nr:MULTISPECIES: ParM/StbA family protein [unclassified Candidatus Frackibacter]SDC31230.1 hypothetical protein SAMN04515661_10687 [Candidatus Frackibacter sp. WG11]SEM73610.1 hypothetical protein SAMN04488698_11430 [Candidatus Frackibacter sp. WG12]SFL59110.1 hypothetical protein SAMN04488699_10686 [Candidatus Frackibacter sp. WG13]